MNETNATQTEKQTSLPGERRFASIKKARKNWICSVCGRLIKAGEQYEFSYEYGGINVINKCSGCIK